VEWNFVSTRDYTRRELQGVRNVQPQRTHDVLRFSLVLLPTHYWCCRGYADDARVVCFTLCCSLRLVLTEPVRTCSETLRTVLQTLVTIYV
jgi:hypothetical protein